MCSQKEELKMGKWENVKIIISFNFLVTNAQNRSLLGWGNMSEELPTSTASIQPDDM
eukprot:m.108985 g.108985  ORF g.108985 m.108985 type:complete len:57 (-) comp27923_c0_seq2:1053-1223(-)